MRSVLFCFVVTACFALTPLAVLHAATEAARTDTAWTPGVAPKPGASGGARDAADSAQRWTLDRLIHETIDGNPQVLSKRAAHLAARRDVAAARWKFLPSPYVQLQRGNGELLNSSYKRLEVYGVQQPIWTGGKLMGGLKVAKAMEKSSAMSVLETRLSLAQAVVSVYQGLLTWHNRIRAQEQGVRLMERYAGIMERRVKAGVSAQTDQTQVNARLFQARDELAESISGSRVAMTQMTQLVGVPFRNGEIVYFSEAQMQMPPPPDSILVRAERVSPVLGRMAAEIETARSETKLQQAALFPNLSLKAEHRNYLYGNDQPAHENTVYASLDYTFGSGLSTLATISSASAKVEGAVQAREAARRDLRARIAADAEECALSLIRYRDRSLSSRAAADVLASYTRLFVAGKRSWLDVLNAARELIQSEVAEGDIVASYWGARYRLRLHAMDESLMGADAPKGPTTTNAPDASIPGEPAPVSGSAPGGAVDPPRPGVSGS